MPYAITPYLVVLLTIAATSSVFAQQLTDTDRAAAIAELVATRQAFAESISRVSDRQWKYKPAQDVWSIAEVAEHIALTESTIFAAIRDRMLKAPPMARPAGSLTDSQLMAALLDRSQKGQAPESLRPANKWPSREALLKDFLAARQLTVSYVRTTSDPLRLHVATDVRKRLLPIEVQQCACFMQPSSLLASRAAWVPSSTPAA